MAVTDLAAVTNQIQKFWSPIFMPELRKASLLPALVNKDYEGEIKKGGDTVRVSQVQAPNGENLDVGTNADSFNPEALSTTSVDLQANKRAVASFKFADLVQLQSQIGDEDSEIRQALVYALGQQINKYLYSLVAPSTSSPDHLRNSTATYDATELGAVRMLAAQARWLTNKGWWVLADPSYYSDLLSAQTLTSRDYTGQDDVPVIAGQIANKRFGFNILEDNSLAVDQAVAFHPDFLLLAMQQMPTFKISDLHPLGQFGYIISVDVIYGAQLGIAGNKKHILSTASASATGIVMAS